MAKAARARPTGPHRRCLPQAPAQPRAARPALAGGTARSGHRPRPRAATRPRERPNRPRTTGPPPDPAPARQPAPAAPTTGPAHSGRWPATSSGERKRRFETPRDSKRPPQEPADGPEAPVAVAFGKNKGCPPMRKPAMAACPAGPVIQSTNCWACACRTWGWRAGFTTITP
jgi:hypothetical protein